jgi:hypothetical protein
LISELRRATTSPEAMFAALRFSQLADRYQARVKVSRGHHLAPRCSRRWSRRCMDLIRERRVEIARQVRDIFRSDGRCGRCRLVCQRTTAIRVSF